MALHLRHRAGQCSCAGGPLGLRARGFDAFEDYDLDGDHALRSLVDTNALIELERMRGTNQQALGLRGRVFTTPAVVAEYTGRGYAHRWPELQRRFGIVVQAPNAVERTTATRLPNLPAGLSNTDRQLIAMARSRRYQLVTADARAAQGARASGVSTRQFTPANTPNAFDALDEFDALDALDELDDFDDFEAFDAFGGDLEDDRFTWGTTGSTCPANWSTTVADDHKRALAMVDGAIRELGAYNGTTPAKVAASLKKHFNGSSVALARWIRLNLQYLRTVAPQARYQCRNQGDEFCSANTNAFTYWCVPFTDIRICSPRYFRNGPRERSRVLVHEWVHRYGCNFDLGYYGTQGYSGASTARALINADPWSHLVNEIS